MLRLGFLIVSAAMVVASEKKIKLGQDDNFPPFAFRDDAGNLAGMSKDIADGMNKLCPDLHIEIVYSKWSDCWSSEGGGETLGFNIESGVLDGCTSYWHLPGTREEYCEFGGSYVADISPAGILTLLVDGKPQVNGLSDFARRRLIDVGGWAPSSESIRTVTNKCTKELYSKSITMKTDHADGNDQAMLQLRAGNGHGIFLMADQADKIVRQCNLSGGTTPNFDCQLWKGFGTDYAYVQTGMRDYMVNGTTLFMGKKGSGIAAILSPCFQSFMQTEAYYDVCVKYGMANSCYRTSFFPESKDPIPVYDLNTDEHKGDCSTGYCPCPEAYSILEFGGAHGLSLLTLQMFLPAMALLVIGRSV